MSIYYPDGSANDPNAPWNEKEVKYKECETCEGSGKHEDYFKEKCATCDGTGEVIDEDEE